MSGEEWKKEIKSVETGLDPDDGSMIFFSDRFLTFRG
jgi:hypothetical protein